MMKTHKEHPSECQDERRGWEFVKGAVDSNIKKKETEICCEPPALFFAHSPLDVFIVTHLDLNLSFNLH